MLPELNWVYFTLRLSLHVQLLPKSLWIVCDCSKKQLSPCCVLLTNNKLPILWKYCTCGLQNSWKEHSETILVYLQQGIKNNKSTFSKWKFLWYILQHLQPLVSVNKHLHYTDSKVTYPAWLKFQKGFFHCSAFLKKMKTSTSIHGDFELSLPDRKLSLRPWNPDIWDRNIQLDIAMTKKIH